MNSTDAAASSKFLRSIFNSPKMSQEEVVANIESINSFTTEAINLLIFGTNWVELNIHPYVHLILVGNFRNKLVLSQDVRDEESDEGQLLYSEGVFLSSAMFVAYSYLDDSVPKSDVVRVLSKSFLSRSSKEFILGSFLRASEQYMRASDAYFRMLARYMNGADVNTDELDALDSNMFMFESIVSGDRNHLYMLIRNIKVLCKRADRLRHEIAVSYRRLVVRLAKKFSPQDGSYFQDNYQNGCIGLTKAISYYDVSKGARFSKVAAVWVKQTLLLLLKEHSNFVRLAQQGWSLQKKFEDAESKLERILGIGNVTQEQIAVHFLKSNDNAVTEKSITKTVERRNLLETQTKMTHVRSLDFKRFDGDPMFSESIMVEAPDEVDDDTGVSLKGLSRLEKTVLLLSIGDINRLRVSVAKHLVEEEKLRQAT